MTNLATDKVIPFPETELVPNTVRVFSGANEMALDVRGDMTIGAIRQRLTEILNLSQEHKALVNGHDAPEDQNIRPGDNVEFVRQAGVKG